MKSCSDSIAHKFFIGFRSGLYAGQFKTGVFLDDRNDFVAFDVWIAVLSCWNIQLLPNESSWKLIKTLSNNSHYLSLFILVDT